MIRKLASKLFPSLLLMQGLTAATDSSNQPMNNEECACPIASTLEVKAGYFFFAESTMRKIYDKGGIDVQLTGAYPFVTWGSHYALELYASVEYFHRSGNAMGSGAKTTIWAIPVNVGLRPVFAICPEVQYYFTLGPRYFYIHQHNDSPYVDKTNHRNGAGLFVNTGFNFIPIPHFLIDIFGEYSYGKTRFHSSRHNVYSKSTQISGFTFGVGIGYSF